MDKKILSVVLSFFLFFGFYQVRISQSVEDNCTIVLKYQVGNKQYYVGNSPYQMDSEPEVKDSRMFLVIRFVTQHIPGTTLEWDGTERKVTITTPTGKTIRLWIGSPKAEVNGKMVLIDPENPEKIVPFIKDGRTKLPMRFVGEQLDASIEWIAASRTVILTIQDIINCGCSWLEGCIVQWTEAPNQQYQLSFVLNCDKKSNLERYLIEKNLKSMSEGVDLIEYLKKYPKPPYPTTKICLNQAKKIIKWDQVRSPETNPPPPPDPPEPPPPDPPPPDPTEKNGQIIIQVPKELYYGTVIQITEKISEDKKIYAVNTSGTCYTGCELICGKTYVIEPINQKVTFVPSSQTVTLKKCCPIEYEEVKFEGKESSCCDYELSQLNESISSLPVGESYSLMFSLKNICPVATKNISFNLVSLSGIMTITPNQFTLEPGQKLPFKVFITMPPDCQNNSLLTFSFSMESDCGIKKEHKFFVKCSAPVPPPEPTMKWICGCFSQFNSESADGTKIWLNATCSEPEGMWKTYMIPKNLKDQNLDLVITEYMTKYPLKKFKSLCIELYVDEKGKVVQWKATPEKYPDCCQPPEQKGPGRIIVSLGSKCAGVGILYGNLTRNEGTKFGEANIKGDFDTECILFFGDTYRIKPRSPFFTFTPEYLDVKITKSCPDGIIRASFDAAEIPPSCCKWQFRLLPEIQSENWTLAPGETKMIEAYEISNNCSLNGNDLQFTINWPNDGKIISIEPSSFILKPSQHQTLKIKITMPEDSKDGEKVVFPYTITPSGCEKKDMQIETHVSRFIVKNSAYLVYMTITDVSHKEGWVLGIKWVVKLDTQEQGFAVLIKIYYEIGNDYWERIKVDHCYKISFDDRNDSSGKLIKWGLDYRMVECT